MRRQVIVPFVLLGLLVGAVYLQRPDQGGTPAGEAPGARPRPALRLAPAPTEREETGIPPGGPVLPEALSPRPGPAVEIRDTPRRRSGRTGRPPLRPIAPQVASPPPSRPGSSRQPAVGLPSAGRTATPHPSGQKPAGDALSAPGSIVEIPSAPDPRPQADAPPPARPLPPSPPPALSPPVLLTAPSDALTETETTAVLLDRQLLTPQLRVAALEGRVVLAILVRADGSVAQVTIRAGSGNEVLDTAAVRAAGAWRFRPATRDGVPTEAWAIIPVRFIVP